MRSAVITILLTMLLIARADAQSRNAAELYRVAGRGVPQAANPGEEFVLKDVLDAPLDDSARSIVQRADTQLSLFDVASGMPFGQWGIDPNDPGYGTHRVIGALELADRVVLRARIRAENNQLEGALRDCGNLSLFSRRLSSEPSLARMRLQVELFKKGCELFGLLALQADQGQIQEFRKHLDELRSPIDPVVVATTERDSYLVFYHRLVSNSEMRYLATRNDVPINDLFGVNQKAVNVDDLWQDSNLAETTFADAQETFDEMTAAIQLAGADRAAATKKAIDRIGQAHPMVRQIGDIFEQIIRLNDTQAAMAGMLRSACAVCATSPRPIDLEAAKAAAAPYSFEPKPDGFTLRATLPDSDQSVILRIGLRTIRQRPTTAQARP